ncbi:MAG TPA: zf-HC2 domain-containing protein [Acidobacteriota bacterium]|nr:zf-HC2 domain-containing protein [Acidobacteriota bacterium]
MTRYQPKDCSRTLQLLDDFIAGELSVESNRDLLSHLESCSACTAERQSREETRQSVRRAWESQPVPEGLQERILDGLDSPPGMMRYLSRAAALLIATLALYALWQFYPLSVEAVDHYYQALRDHFKCSSDPGEHGQLPVLPSNPAWGEALAELPGEYSLGMAHFCQAEGVSFIHYPFLTRDGEHRISIVLEVRRDGQQLASREDLARQVIASLDVNVFNHPEATVIAAEDEDFFIYLVSEDTDQELLAAWTEALMPRLKSLL